MFPELVAEKKRSELGLLWGIHPLWNGTGGFRYLWKVFQMNQFNTMTNVFIFIGQFGCRKVRSCIKFSLKHRQ
jgi:hypothetical protein